MITIHLTEDKTLAAPLARVEAECFTHPLEEKRIAALLQDANTHFFAALDGNDVVGSVWVQTVLDEGYIGNVAVRPAFRRRGIADDLLSALAAFGREKGLSFLTLEVRASNTPAVSLYEKNGYVRVGCRTGYYSDPREDAVLMTYYL